MTGCSTAGQAKSITLGEVVRAALPDFSQTHRLPVHHWKVLRAIAACHTPALGGHQYQCSDCGKEHFVPHSCGNRHCPSCQKLKSAQWLDQQIEHLLPIPYFHVVSSANSGVVRWTRTYGPRQRQPSEAGVIRLQYRPASTKAVAAPRYRLSGLVLYY